MSTTHENGDDMTSRRRRRKSTSVARSSNGRTKISANTRQSTLRLRRRKVKVAPLHETIRRQLIKAVNATTTLRQAASGLEVPYSSLRYQLDQYGIDGLGRKATNHRSLPTFSLKNQSWNG